MHHRLKVWPKYYKDLYTGEKNFEVRVNDRNFQVGDTVTLYEWNPGTKSETGLEIIKRISYIFEGDVAAGVPLPYRVCVLGLRSL